MTSHRITHADDVRTGAAESANRAERGVPLSNVVTQRIQPATADADGISLSQAVSAGADALINGALASDGVATFDVPRNVVAAWTTASVITVYGTDEYGNAMAESSASGTSFAGKKAFKTITRITSTASITGFTAGSGDVLGLKYRPIVGGFIRGVVGENTSDAGTYVAPERSASSATSGDVRGTYDPAATVNGSNVFTLTYIVANGPKAEDAFGIDQFAG